MRMRGAPGGGDLLYDVVDGAVVQDFGGEAGPRARGEDARLDQNAMALNPMSRSMVAITTLIR